MLNSEGSLARRKVFLRRGSRALKESRCLKRVIALRRPTNNSSLEYRRRALERQHRGCYSLNSRHSGVVVHV